MILDKLTIKEFNHMRACSKSLQNVISEYSEKKMESYIIIINRKTWLSRDRETYFGTLFIETGVIFQYPPLTKIHVISEPLIKIRYGQGMWEPKSFEIWYFKWPELIWSFPHYSDIAKQKITPKKKWRKITNLLKARAFGHYSNKEFKKILSVDNNPLYIFCNSKNSCFKSCKR